MSDNNINQENKNNDNVNDNILETKNEDTFKKEIENKNKEEVVKKMKQEENDLKVPAAKEAEPLLSIGRAPSDSEMADWSGGIVNGATVEKIYRNKINEIQKKYTAMYKPYDRFCAIRDLREVLEKLGREKQRQANLALDTAKRIKLRLPDFESYGDPERFDFVSFSECRVPSKRGSSETSLKGMYENYVCKRGDKYTVFVPLQIWVQRNPKEAKKRGFLDKEGNIVENL